MQDISQEEKVWEENEEDFFSVSTAPGSPDKNAAGVAADRPHNLVNTTTNSTNHNNTDPLGPLDEAERQLLLQQYQQFMLVHQKVNLARQYFDSVTRERHELDEQFNSRKRTAALSDDDYDAQRKKLATLKVTATALLFAALQEEQTARQQTPAFVINAVTHPQSFGNSSSSNAAVVVPSPSSLGQQASV